MPRFEDYGSDPEVRDIMERFIKKFPTVFEGFELDDIGFVLTKKKPTPSSEVIKLRTVAYPHYVFSNKTYIVEVLEELWVDMNQKQKNLAVFHILCGIPIGGFDPLAQTYGKKVKPDIVMYRLEYAAAGGIPNWMEDDRASDPMEIKADEVSSPKEDDDDEDAIPVVPKKPVTASDIVGSGDEEDIAS